MHARAMGERGSEKGIVESLVIHASDTMAWVTFTRRYPEVPAHRVGPNPAHQLRILEKHDGHWKISLVGFLDPSMGQPKSAVLRLDAAGRVMWISAAAELALAEHNDLAIRGGRVHARDTKLDQRLQASIKWAAKLERHFLPARGAVPIVIEAGEGAAAKVWWIISDGGAILLSLDNSDSSAGQIEAATAVYGLSSAQKTLAVHVVAGRSIEEIAALTKVKRSTARTHLDRIFDKTGVRDRTALVRLLLSTMAPL